MAGAPCCVYDILQEMRGDPQLQRLLGQLDELSGRLEHARHLDPSRTASTVGTALPCPGDGHLPVFPRGCEYAALQRAAEEAAQRVPPHQSRDDWMRWAMSSTHAALVVDLAWHHMAASSSEASAALLQDQVVGLFSQHYVTMLLDASIPSKDLYVPLWLQMMATATVDLSRQVLPDHSSCPPPPKQQLHAHLHQQLRLWLTGLLPRDAAELATVRVAATAAAASPEGAAEPDRGILATSSRVAAQQQQRAVADLVSCKPGALVSAFLSHHAAAPSRLWQQRLAAAGPSSSSSAAGGTDDAGSGAAAAAPGNPAGTGAQGADVAAEGGRAGAAPPAAPAAGNGAGGWRSQAAACLADAAAAVQRYQRSTAEASAGHRRARAALQQQQADMRQRLKDACSSAKAWHGCSDVLSGWLDTSLYAPQPQVDSSVTDARCKQQRQRSDLELRALDAAHRSTRRVRNTDSLDMAAAAAARPVACARAQAAACAGRAAAAAAPTASGAGGSAARPSSHSSSSSSSPPDAAAPRRGSVQPPVVCTQLAGCTLRSQGGPNSGVRIMKAARPAVAAARKQLGLQV